MGVCIDRLPHSCGTRNGLQVFQDEETGKIDGFCFCCKQYIEEPYADKPNGFKPKKIKVKTKEEIDAEIADIHLLSTVDLPDRKLRKSTLDYYGIKIGFSEEDGQTPAFHYYPYYREGEIVAYKVRLIALKRMWSIGDMKEVDLFGWEQALATGNKRLIITEGELDACALRRTLELYTKEQYRDNIPAVVSLPHGAAAASKDIGKLLPKIRSHFKEISLCFDNDEPGKKAAEEVCKVVPEATIITLPNKDANECVLKGNSKALFNAVMFNHKRPKNTRLVWGSQVHEEAKKAPEWGYSWPWAILNDTTRGIRLGETIYFGAGVKMGKSELVNALGAHLIREHGWKIMMAKPEEANVKTYKLLAGKIVGKVFHDPKVEFDEAAYEQAGEVIKDNICMVNLYQHLGWETLKEDIRAAALEGCRAIFVDPITNLTNGMESAAANVKLQEIAQELAALALDLNVVIFIFCHLKAPEGGKTPHERGGKVLSTQFAGSRAMMRSCNYMIGLEGNKDPDLPDHERNQRKLIILEDREFGETCTVNLFWNKNTHLFEEM